MGQHTLGNLKVAEVDRMAELLRMTADFIQSEAVEGHGRCVLEGMAMLHETIGNLLTDWVRQWKKMPETTPELLVLLVALSEEEEDAQRRQHSPVDGTG